MKPTEIRSTLISLGVGPSRRLGQSFLLDERHAARQVAAADLGPADTILEIGPGLGVLTKALAATGRRTVVIEKDRRLAQHIRLSGLPVEVIEGDALDLPWPSFEWCISNFPFSISSPLLFKLLSSSFKGAVLMVQREFARRMVAEAGSPAYSRLTVKAHYRGESELLWAVPPSAFWPQPEVSAAVVRVRARPAPYMPVDGPAYLDLVDLLFQHRRKRVGTILASAPATLPLAAGWRERVSTHLLMARPEQLPPEELARLSDSLFAPQG